MTSTECQSPFSHLPIGIATVHVPCRISCLLFVPQYAILDDEVRQMTWLNRYLTYFRALTEGTREPPEGISLTETDATRRAAQLQAQIMALGVPEFLRRCAEADGETLSAEELADYSDEALLQALTGAAETEEAPDPSEPPRIDEPDGPRPVCEVLLDCCMLDDALSAYLVDICKRGADDEFQRLALVTTRKAFTLAEFLRWFADKEERGGEEEQLCVRVMDACLARLAAEKEGELLAALLSGDQNTFEIFRCEAPELVHLPAATYDWYARHYLAGYYPVRFLLKYNGVQFPAGEEEENDT